MKVTLTLTRRHVWLWGLLFICQVGTSWLFLLRFNLIPPTFGFDHYFLLLALLSALAQVSFVTTVVVIELWEVARGRRPGRYIHFERG